MPLPAMNRTNLLFEADFAFMASQSTTLPAGMVISSGPTNTQLAPAGSRFLDRFGAGGVDGFHQSQEGSEVATFDGKLRSQNLAAAPGGSPFSLVAGSGLRITATKLPTPYTLGGFSVTHASGTLTTSKWYLTEPLFEFKYGTVRGRVRADSVMGAWAAFWLFQPGNKNEADLVEILGKYPLIPFQTVHATGGGQAGQFAGTPAGWSAASAADWHEYAADWTPSGIDFYLDGVLRGTVPAYTGIDIAMQVNLTLACGSSTGGSSNWAGPATAQNFTMDVDYVRVFRNAYTVDGSTKRSAANYPFAAVSGSVTYQGTAQAGAAVKLDDGAGTAITLTSDASGAVTGQLPVGVYAVTVTPPSGTVVQSAPSSVTVGQAGVGVSASIGAIVLKSAVQPAPTGTNTISGQVKVNQSGYPGATGCVLTLCDTSGTPYTNTVTAGPNGAFNFDGLAAGSYRLRCALPAGSTWHLGFSFDAATGLSTGTFAAPSFQSLRILP